MLNDRRGFNAIFDVSVFIVLILLCIPLLFHSVPDDVERVDAGDVMDAIVGTRLHVSDVTQLEDDTVHGMYDLLAYSAYSGDPGPIEYVDEYLKSVLSGHGYFLTAEYRGKVVTTGEQTGSESSRSERQCTVSFGGTVDLILYVYD